MSRDKKLTNDICVHCGRRLNEHWTVNYSNDPFRSAEVYVCPSAVFKPKEPEDV